MEPIRVDKPYPDVNEVMPNLKTAKIISPAYASQKSELGAIHQYIYHSVQFWNQNENEIAEILDGIAEAEMNHLDILAKTLIRLGVAPIFSANPPLRMNFFNTKDVNYCSNQIDMIKADIQGEKQVIIDYTKMLEQLDDQVVASIIQRIKEDEELHVIKLTEILEELEKSNTSRYRRL